MEAINPKRRAEKQEMLSLGFTSKKAYRKWQKKQRHAAKSSDKK